MVWQLPPYAGTTSSGEASMAAACTEGLRPPTNSQSCMWAIRKAEPQTPNKPSDDWTFRRGHTAPS